MRAEFHVTGMTHEPECLWQDEAMPPRAEVCRDCVIARAAYQRGREDASQQVMVDIAVKGYSPTAGFGDELAAAARGDGERK